MFLYASLSFGLILSVSLNTSLAQRSSPQPDTGKHLIVRYYPDGRVREKGYQGYYTNRQVSTGTYIGLWKIYNKRGVIKASTYYHNDVPKKAFIEKKVYYPNGTLKSVERYNNYELYEADTIHIGTWSCFNTKGKLIKQIKHPPTKKHD